MMLANERLNGSDVFEGFIPHYGVDMANLLRGLLQPNPQRRLSLADVVVHPCTRVPIEDGCIEEIVQVAKHEMRLRLQPFAFPLHKTLPGH